MSDDTEEFHDAMMCAFDEAADGLDIWEFGGAETKEEYDLHRKAATEVAKRIRRMAARYDAQWYKRSSRR